ncbi:MAG: M56 family metallopeptidase [Planctomycetaceae bacterium]|nr:M56 family metallopeptidase [Planctomycetaceae bacterium]
MADVVLLDGVAVAGLAVLIRSAIQATGLLVMVGLIAWMMRSASAAVRHLLWLGTMIALAGFPLATAFFPGWHVLPHWEAARAVQERAPSVATVESPATKPISEVSPVSDRRENQLAAVHQDDDDVATVGPPARARAPAQSWKSWQALILVVWAIGCLVAWLPVAGGTVSLAWLEWTSARVKGGPLDSALRRAATRLGLKRSVRLLVNERRSMPMMWGVLWPRVLIPAAAETWPADRIEAVLMHELAHVRRCDCLSQFAARAVCSLYWYHPLAWWAAKRMRSEAETACDNRVILAGCRPADYAEHLLQIVAGTRSALPLGSAAIGMAWCSQMEVRLRTILDEGRNRLGLNAVSTAGCAVLVLGLSSPLALLRSEAPTDRPLQDRPAGANPFLPQDTTAAWEGIPLPLRLGYVDNTAEGSQSIAGGGHAVKFRRPEDTRFLMAVEIFGHRYGETDPPAEDFHVYILDGDQRLLQAYPYPYAQMEWGHSRWHTLKLPAVEVPQEFYVVLVFNPHQRKGVFLGLDTGVKQSHSYIGRPTTGLEPVSEGFDWMVRSVLTREIPTQNPFEPKAE